MSPSSTPARPPQVTLAGWMIILGSVMVVLSTVELLSGLRSLETRQGIEDFLAEPAGQSLGLDVEGVLQLWRIAGLVAAGCATAAVVLGWHVLRRHRGARIGLTVIAVPLFFSGIATGGFLTALVAAASLMLWLQPARDWFDGKQPASAPRPGGFDRPPFPPQQPPVPPAAGPPAAGEQPPVGTDDPVQPPRPMSGFGDPAASRMPIPGVRDDDPRAQRPPVERPESVLVASLITWVTSGLVAFFFGLSTWLMAGDGATLLEELEQANPEAMAELQLGEQTLVGMVVAIGTVLVLWALAAAVLALLTLRGSTGAAIALIVSSVVTAVLCLVAAFIQPLLVLPGVAAAVVVMLLRRPEVRAWLVERRRAASQPGGGAPPRR